jgi:prephenate dehydrogenase
LDGRVLELGLEEHDAIFAKTSHLPHVIAFTLVNYLSQQEDRQQLFDLAAAGFYDFTRIASSDAQMWRDICITNKEQVLDALRGFKHQIESIERQVVLGEQDGILTYFETAQKARDSGLLNKARSVLDDT